MNINLYKNEISIEKTEEFEKAFEAMAYSRNNVFITGKAGTGKSTLLQYFRKNTSKKIAVLAPTGVAALHIKGETIHSFFKFKTNITVKDAQKQAEKLMHTAHFEYLDTIIIDEISMVRADLMDCIDIFLKTVLKSTKPFGGLQMIFIGDLYQLPPVINREEALYFKEVYKSPYFFSSKVIENLSSDLEIIELNKIYRQKNEKFIEILNAIRNKTITKEQLLELNLRVEKIESKLKDEVYLTTTNAKAQQINDEELAKIKDDEYVLFASMSKNFDEKIAPTEVRLKLKIGAQVMFVCNDQSGLFVNGTIGHVKNIDEYESEIEVETQDGLTVCVEPHKWSMQKYVYDNKARSLKQESTGTFTQYPLKLAWAITIHKSQGKTFKNVVVDLGTGAFANGQVYVALSRCETMEGLVLKRPIRPYEILVDPAVTNYFGKSKIRSGNEESLNFEEKFERIKSAIETESSVTITYISNSREATTRTVYPKKMGRLKSSNNEMCVQCFCYEKQDIRLFKLDRIIALN